VITVEEKSLNKSERVFRFTPAQDQNPGKLFFVFTRDDLELTRIIYKSEKYGEFDLFAVEPIKPRTFTEEDFNIGTCRDLLPGELNDFETVF
jgi:hypothetical protein